MNGTNVPEPAERAAILRQFATWTDSQRLQFLTDAVTIHANRGGKDTVYWAVISPAPPRARRKPKGTDAARPA